MQAWHKGLFSHGLPRQDAGKVNLASGKIPLLCCTKKIPLVSTQTAPIRSRFIPQCPCKSEEPEGGYPKLSFHPSPQKL